MLIIKTNQADILRKFSVEIVVHLGASQNKSHWYCPGSPVPRPKRPWPYHLTFLDFHLLIFKNGGLFQLEFFKSSNRWHLLFWVTHSCVNSSAVPGWRHPWAWSACSIVLIATNQHEIRHLSYVKRHTICSSLPLCKVVTNSMLLWNLHI